MILENVLRESRQFWGNLAVRDRRIVMGFAVAVVMVFVGLMFLVTLQEPYETTINVDPNRLAQVKQALAQAGVEAEYPAAGVVTVRPSEADKARYALFQVMALPPQQLGMERFDGEKFGLTKDVRDAQLLLAREVQLKRALEYPDFVRYADVKLTPAERRLVVGQSTDAAASVMVDVGEEELTSAQVRAIENTVLGYVPGIKRQNIAIVDQHFNQLNPSEPGTAQDQMRSRQQAYVASQEFRLESNARNLLEPFVGKNNFRVSAYVDMDFKDMQREVTEYGPKARVSEDETSSRESTTTTPGGGQPGVNSNVPDAGVTGVAKATVLSKETEETTHPKNIYDTTHEVSTQNQANLLKKTLAVTVDSAALRRMAHDRLAGGVASATPASATSEDAEMASVLAVISDVLSAGMGLAPNRDVLTVAHLPLDRTPEIEREKYAYQKWLREQIETWMPVAGIVLVMVLLSAAFYYLRRRKLVEITAPIEEMERTMAEPKRELSLYELGIQDMSDIASLPPEEQRRVLLRREVEEFAMKRREEAAQIIKGWLSEGQ